VVRITNYQSGRRFEYRVRDLFKEHGFQAKRKASSSPYDILVLKEGKSQFVVDAKHTSQRDKEYIYISRGDVEKIVEIARELNCTPLVCYGFYRTPIYAEFGEKLLKENDGKNIRLEEGEKLKRFLNMFGKRESSTQT